MTKEQLEEQRKRFNRFMFGSVGHNLHSMINSGECSANWFAFEIWKACEANLEEMAFYAGDLNGKLGDFRIALVKQDNNLKLDESLYTFKKDYL
jgi:hypothetical protein